MEPAQRVHYNEACIESKNSLIPAVLFQRIFQVTVNILMTSVNLPEKPSSLFCKIKEACQIHVDTSVFTDVFHDCMAKATKQ